MREGEHARPQGEGLRIGTTGGSIVMRTCLHDGLAAFRHDRMRAFQVHGMRSWRKARMREGKHAGGIACVLTSPPAWPHAQMPACYHASMQRVALTAPRAGLSACWAAAMPACGEVGMAPSLVRLTDPGPWDRTPETNDKRRSLGRPVANRGCLHGCMAACRKARMRSGVRAALRPSGAELHEVLGRNAGQHVLVSAPDAPLAFDGIDVPARRGGAGLLERL